MSAVKAQTLSYKPFYLRIRLPDGQTRNIHDLDQFSTLEELVLAVSKMVKSEKPGTFKLLCFSSMPPADLTKLPPSKVLDSVPLKCGDSLTVAPADSPSSQREPLPTAAPAVPTAGSSRSNASLPAPPPAAKYPRKTRPFRDPRTTPSLLMRQKVPSNNSCLFLAVDYLLHNGELNLDASDPLRDEIAAVVLSSPDHYNEAFLGKPNEEYASWIRRKETWGGGIELAILSDTLKVEIAVVNTKMASIQRFGEDRKLEKRIFLIYDGTHFDPLVREYLDGDSGSEDDGADAEGTKRVQHVFDVTDDRALEQAAELATEAKSVREYSSLGCDAQAHVHLLCGVCGTHVFSQAAAIQHAVNSTHNDFHEIDDQVPAAAAAPVGGDK